MSRMNFCQTKTWWKFESFGVEVKPETPHNMLIFRGYNPYFWDPKPSPNQHVSVVLLQTPPSDSPETPHLQNRLNLLGLQYVLQAEPWLGKWMNMQFLWVTWKWWGPWDETTLNLTGTCCHWILNYLVAVLLMGRNPNTRVSMWMNAHLHKWVQP